MYILGRVFFVLGHRNFSQKLCGCVNRVALLAAHKSENETFHQRNYCESRKDDNAEFPKLIPLHEEVAEKLKVLLEDPQKRTKLKVLHLEVDLMRQSCERVPDVMTDRHWYELLLLESRGKRKRYLEFAWKVERKKMTHRVNQEAKRKAAEDRGPAETPYKLGGNTMFLRIYEATMNRLWNSNVFNAMMYGQPLVMDCGYDSHMTRREQLNCARQLNISLATNRIHNEPFNMYLCNADLSGEMMKCLHRQVPPLFEKDYPINIETKSYLDLFDKDQLVYLTPHCKLEMTEFDHNAVYIIGAFVDMSSNEAVSLSKAKKEGLKMRKLPLDRYLDWGTSSGKNLTLNAVLSILLDIRTTGDWNEALKHVPRRKLVESRTLMAEQRNERIFNGTHTVRLSDADSEDSSSEESTPLRVIRPKVTARFNADRRPTFDSRTNFRMNNDSVSETRHVNENTPISDFSMAGRLKIKKNPKY